MIRNALIVMCVLAPASFAPGESGTSNGWQWERLARLGDATPAGDIWQVLGVPAINNGLTSWWGAGETDGQHVILHDGIESQQIADQSGQGFIGTDQPIALYYRDAPQVTPDGRVLYHSSQGVYIWDNGINTQLATPAVIETSLVDETSRWGSPVLVGGEVVFPAGLEVVGRPFWRYYGSLLSVPAAGGVVQRIASDQSTVPGLTGTALEFIDGDNRATTSSLIRLATDGQRIIMNASDALSDTEGIYIRNTDGTFDMVADQSTTAGAGATGTFESFAGHVALTPDTAYFTAREAAAPWGIYTSTNGVIEKLVDTSMVVRTDFPDTLDYIGAMAVANDIVVFQGAWDSGDDGIGPLWGGGIFAIIDGQVETILTRGQMLDGLIVESAHLTADSFDSEYLALKVYFYENGDAPTQGIYKIRIPTPSSLALLTAASLITTRRIRG